MANLLATRDPSVVRRRDPRPGSYQYSHGLSDWLADKGLDQDMLFFDEDLASMLKSFEGTDYWDRALANPYLEFTRKRGFGDDLIGLFTSSPYDRAWDEQRQAAAEYFSKLRNNMDEQKYDSPLEQAERMRAAGQNPDLLGTSGVSESPTMDMPIVSPDLSQGPGIMDFVNVVSTAITMAFSLAKDAKSLQAAGLSNDAAEIRNIKDMYGFAEGLQGSGVQSLEASDGEVPRFNPFKSRRLKKSFEDSWSVSWKSLKQLKDYHENYYGAGEASAKSARQVSSKFYAPPMNDPFTNQDIFSGLSAISDVTTELVNKVDKQMAELNLKKISNEQTYEDSIDPALQAQTENAQNKEAKEAVSMTNQMNASMRELTNKLYMDYKKGNKFSGFLLMSFNMLRLMSVGVTSGSGPKGRNSGFSFGLR